MNVNSLQQKKKRSEMMGEYVAGKNRVNVMPLRTQFGATYRQPVKQGVTRVAEIADAEYKRHQELHQGARSRAQSIIESRTASTPQESTPQTGGTVLTQEQILANNINDIIKQMNNIMSQPGQMLAPSYSPYYNIYMEQYRQNAEKAKASAYAQAVAGTGGYGSSYATLAGQQAYRDTMEGFTELTPSLVQTKGQAMSDLMEQYQMAKGIKEELGANETGASTYTRSTGETVAVDDTKVQGAYDYIASVVQSAGGTLDQVENTVREGLKNQRTADGEAYTEDEINAAMERYKGVEGAAVADTQKNTATIAEKGLNRTSDLNTDDLTTLGIDATAWGEMDEGTRKTTLLDALGQAKKDGKLSAVQFANIIEEDILAGVDDILKEDDKYELRDISKYIIALDDYQTEGVLSSDFKTEIMAEIAKKLKNYKKYGDVVEAFGEYESELRYTEQLMGETGGKWLATRTKPEVRGVLGTLQNQEQIDAIVQLLKLKV